MTVTAEAPAVDQTGSGFSLEGLIAEVLEESNEASPDHLIYEVIRRIPEDHVWEALENALAPRIRAVIWRQRGQITRSNRSDRWEQVRADHESGALDIMRLRVSVGGSWKLLSDCSAGDVTLMASQYDEEVEKLQATAERYRLLHRKMEEEGATTVGALAPTVVEGILLN